jgi:hypothetical protein
LQVLFGGEVDPSDKGHAGAGQFSNETFCFDTVLPHISPFIIHSHAAMQDGHDCLAGEARALAIILFSCCMQAKGGSGWHKLSPDGPAPTPRGWFASCTSVKGLLVHGGNSPSNERLGDMHLLSLH